jgi:phosphoglycolate phosphatase-like HAD superfamily hydrolase
MEEIMKYRALVSSDWSECLAPTGPFDVITFHFPELAPDLAKIFKDYTGNRVSLGAAIEKVNRLLPEPIDREKMDAYLDAAFVTYRGVPEFIEWCLQNEILFMINTTAFQGFCQRTLAKGLLPPVPIVSAHPRVRYQEAGGARLLDLFETSDKPVNTEAVMKETGIAPERVVLVGDSGGDGPHFAWGHSVGARLVGSMTKASLEDHCADRGITIDRHFGLSYAGGGARDPDKEMEVDFAELAGVVEDLLT